MAIIINIDVMLAKRKMSVTELAEKVGITMANISVLKNGKAKAIRLSTLEALCKALSASPEIFWNTVPISRVSQACRRLQRRLHSDQELDRFGPTRRGRCDRRASQRMTGAGGGEILTHTWRTPAARAVTRFVRRVNQRDPRIKAGNRIIVSIFLPERPVRRAGEPRRPDVRDGRPDCVVGHSDSPRPTRSRCGWSGGGGKRSARGRSSRTCRRVSLMPSFPHLSADQTRGRSGPIITRLLVINGGSFASQDTGVRGGRWRGISP